MSAPIQFNKKEVADLMAERQLPMFMHADVYMWLQYGYAPGSFLWSMLCNDFFGVINRGDQDNLDCLREWARFWVNDVPIGCYGSLERCKAWQEQQKPNRLVEGE